jgi:hypothetical protein
MAHYAILDGNNIVTQVFVGKDEAEEGADWESYYGAKRTSYNTRGGVHSSGGTPFRKNFAGIGYTYDEERDAFVAPQPYPSWTLSEDTCLWEPPVAYPLDGNRYEWDEENGQWVEIGD